MVSSYLIKTALQPQSHVHCLPVVHLQCGFMDYHHTSVCCNHMVASNPEMFLLLLHVFHTLPNALLIWITVNHKDRGSSTHVYKPTMI